MAIAIMTRWRMPPESSWGNARSRVCGSGMPTAPSSSSAAASDPALLATDLVDYLVRKGVPFRHAHHTVGAVVAFAERSGKSLSELSPAELQSVDEALGRDAVKIFDLSASSIARLNAFF